jgi:hypothetical protein
LARDFISEAFETEYNNLKHGFRVKSGGSYFALGVEDTLGVPAPPERMRMFAKSDFGSTFLVAQKLRDRQLTFGSTSLHWNPHRLARRIPLAVRCIENVIRYLTFLNDNATAEYVVIPLTTQEVEEVLAIHSRNFRWTWNGRVSAEEVPDLSADEIPSRYKPVTFRPVRSSDDS